MSVKATVRVHRLLLINLTLSKRQWPLGSMGNAVVPPWVRRGGERDPFRERAQVCHWFFLLSTHKAITSPITSHHRVMSSQEKPNLLIDGYTLTTQELFNLSFGGTNIALAPEAVERVVNGRMVVGERKPAKQPELLIKRVLGALANKSDTNARKICTNSSGPLYLIP